MPVDYGSIIEGAQVEQAVIDTLRLWFPTYLAEFERRHSFAAGSLPLPRSYTTRNEFDKWEDEQIPAVIVVSPGLNGRPTRQGDGSYLASWIVGVGIVVVGVDPGNSNMLAKLYAACARLIMIQQRSLGGFARGVSWLDESYDDVPSEATRTLVAGQVIFSVEVSEVLDSFRGPVEPDDTESYYTIDTATMTVNQTRGG